MEAGQDRNRDGTGGGEGGCLLEGIFGLLGIVWALGTPTLAYAAAIASASFFGEQPTAQRHEQAKWLLFGALACGFLAPLLGLSLAAWSGRKLVAIGFAVALGLAALAGAATGILSRDSLRELRDELAPPTSTSMRPIPCQEHSGGDNRCPGG